MSDVVEIQVLISTVTVVEVSISSVVMSDVVDIPVLISTVAVVEVISEALICQVCLTSLF